MKLSCPHCHNELSWRQENFTQTSPSDWKLAKCPRCGGVCVLRNRMKEPPEPVQMQSFQSRPEVRKSTGRMRDFVAPEKPKVDRPLPQALPDAPSLSIRSRLVPVGIALAFIGFIASGWFFLKQAERLQASRHTDRINRSQAATR